MGDLACRISDDIVPSMRDDDTNGEARFAALHRQLRATQARLVEARAYRDALAAAVTEAELDGAVAPIGLLADLNEAGRPMASLEDDVLDAECALIMAGAHCCDDKPEEDDQF